MLSGLLGSRNKRWTNKNKKKSPTTLTVATIMLQLTFIDGKKSAAETDQLREVLLREFKLPPNETDAVLESAGQSLAKHSDLESLAKEVRDGWGNARRIQLLSHIWILAYADDHVDTKETEFIERLADLLRLNDAERYRAQTAAEQHFGLDQFS